jgi:hypothetical protein
VRQVALVAVLVLIHSARPKVISAKDVPPKAKATGFKLYDAVLSADKPPVPEADEEMEKFLPMLNEYLRRTLIQSFQTC